MQDRLQIVQDNLTRYLVDAPAGANRRADDEPLREGTTLTVRRAVDLFEDQVRSREVDVAARELRSRGVGYYTISSAGHEQNATLGALLRPTDPCFLHYRSGAFMMARSRHAPRTDPVRDILLSVVAAADDPIAQGRHKVWGSRDLWVPPQTSTIASHLPKAVGTAFGLGRRSRSARGGEPADDAIVCCSFGDASVNHASALSAINAARYSQRRGSPTPILFVCEDNGLGISVDTPQGWIEATYTDQRQLAYVLADGDLVDVWNRAEEAVAACRKGRTPVFLHLKTVRLGGHAGSDVESAYRPLDGIEADERRDPLLDNARLLVESGAARPAELREMRERVREDVRRQAERVAGSPALDRRETVMAPLTGYDADASRTAATVTLTERERERIFGGSLPEDATAAPHRTLAARINDGLCEAMGQRGGIVVFGEDVGRKGGVYHVTAGLQETFGAQRVFDTLLDETTILGVAQGMALLGFLPIPEIQYLAYVHNALDQIRGEAASTSFFSAGQYRNPMVVRIASFAYQKGFGGHFHNDNSIGALRDIPGVMLAAPSRGEDAVRMLRAAIGIAVAHGRVVCFLEPIALYHTRDLYEDGDGLWLSDYPCPDDVLLPGEVGVYNEASDDVLIVSYANGLRMSLRAARRLRDGHGIRARVLDVRWLQPLPFAQIRRHAGECGRVLVADECRSTGGGIADAVLAHLAEATFSGTVTSVRSADSFVPLGPAANAVLLDEDDIVAATLSLLA